MFCFIINLGNLYLFGLILNHIQIGIPTLLNILSSNMM